MAYRSHSQKTNKKKPKAPKNIAKIKDRKAKIGLG
jgi:hypothetical protein